MQAIHLKNPHPRHEKTDQSSIDPAIEQNYRRPLFPDGLHLHPDRHPNADFWRAKPQNHRDHLYRHAHHYGHFRIYLFVIFTALYNALAKVFGGIEFELKDVKEPKGEA